MRYLVSLVGELVIPNLLVIKTIEGIDSHLFITPKRLAQEGSIARLCSLCGIKDPQVLVVEEFRLEDIDRALAGFIAGQPSDASYVVNLTAGSRIMALAAFDTFRKHDAQILYLPPGTNALQQLWPEHSEAHLRIDYRLSQEEYLRAYGMESLSKGEKPHSERQLETMFRLITQNSNSDFMGRLNRLGSESNSPKARQQQDDTALFFARELDTEARELFDPQWLNFLKGAWFEEYFAHWVNKVLGPGTASYGVKMEKERVDNEIDTLFTWENTLYVCELKASAQIGAVNDILYKLDSVGRDFGMSPRCFLVIADPDVERGLSYSPHLFSRARRMGIGIITYKQLKPDNMEDTIRTMTTNEF